MIEHEHETLFLDWIQGRMAGVQAPGLRISVMREAGGIDYRQAETQSVAMQCEFAGIEEARKWGREVLAPVCADFEKAFAPAAIVFTSIFETLGGS